MWIKIFVRLSWLNDIEIKYISDKKIIKFLWKKGNKIKWNLLKKIKWKKKTYWNIILKNKIKGSQRELKRNACKINCREVVFWSSIQQLLAKSHSIQF